MAYTADQNKAIADFVAANINNPEVIAAKANELGVSAQAIAEATGFSPAQVNSYFGSADLTIPQDTTTGTIENKPVDIGTLINNIIADEGVSTAEAIELNNYMRDNNLTANDVAQKSGVDLKVISQLTDKYDTSIKNAVSGFTSAYGSDDSDALKNSIGTILAMYKAGVSASDISKMSGGQFTEKNVQDYINGVSNFGTSINDLVRSGSANAEGIKNLLQTSDEKTLRAVYGDDAIDQLTGFVNTQGAQTETVSQADASKATPSTPAQITDYRGKTYDTNTLLTLAKQLAPTLNTEQLAGGVFGTQGQSVGFDYDQSTAALGYAPSSGEQVLLDMARHLMDEGVSDISQVNTSDKNRRFGSTYTGEGGTIYEIRTNPDTGKLETSTWGKTTSDAGTIATLVSIGLGLLGAPVELGSSILGPGVSQATAGAFGGSLIGAGTAALTDQDILTGILTGAGAGYVSGGGLSDLMGAGDSMYSLANGTPNLDYMGGGQGLTSTAAGNLTSMGGGQGLTILGGVPSTTLAEALSSFAGVNPSVLSDMGIGQGITYVTPSGIVTENGTIIGGDVISQLGANTGFDLQGWLDQNVGAGIGDKLASVDTGVNSGYTGLGTDTSKLTLDNVTSKINDLTLSDVGNIAKIGLMTTSLANGLNDNTGITGFGIVPVPSDWKTPTYGQTENWQAPAQIDFGSPEMLRGTQWEKYLGQLPDYTPTIAQAPMNMSYQQLINTLQGGGGANLSIGDIISGIQGQYGQTPASTVG